MSLFLLVSIASAGTGSAGISQTYLEDSAKTFASRQSCIAGGVIPLPAADYSTPDHTVYYNNVLNQYNGDVNAAGSFWNSLIAACFKIEQNEFRLKDAKSGNCVLVQTAAANWPLRGADGFTFDPSLGQYFTVRSSTNDLCAFGCKSNVLSAKQSCALAYTGSTDTSTLCSQANIQALYNPATRKHRKDDEDESTADESHASHLSRRADSDNLFTDSVIYFKRTVSRGLCFVTQQDLLNRPNYFKESDPCGNKRALTKCNINGTAKVGSSNTPVGILYACYKIDRNVDYNGASSCQLIKKYHGDDDSEADTFISGFETYMVKNPWLWRPCWSYPGQTSIPRSSLASTDPMWTEEGQNEGAATIDYRISKGSYFKNFVCLKDDDGGRGSQGYDGGAYRLLRTQIFDATFGTNGVSMTLSKCLYSGSIQGWYINLI